MDDVVYKAFCVLLVVIVIVSYYLSRRYGQHRYDYLRNGQSL